jgi:hypothetical protein
MVLIMSKIDKSERNKIRLMQIKLIDLMIEFRVKNK